MHSGASDDVPKTRQAMHCYTSERACCLAIAGSQLDDDISSIGHCHLANLHPTEPRADARLLNMIL